MAEDWIDTFMASTEGTYSPRRFRLWSAISTIAGALERRVYTKGKLTTYPNLFVALAGGSGNGKTVGAMHARDFWAGLPNSRWPPTT